MLDFTLLKQETEKLGTLRKAPIQEAVIAFNFKKGEPSDLEAAAKGAFPDLLWTRQTKAVVNITMPLEGNLSALTSEATQSGARFIGKDEAQNVTLILDEGQLAVGMPAPYTDWEDFSGKALHLWQALSNYAGLELGSHGLRYINQLQFELPLEEYLRDSVCARYPQSAIPIIQQVLQSAFMIAGYPYGAVVTSNFQPISTELLVKGNLTLDIDIGMRDQSQALIKHPQQLEHLRLIKNYFFYHTVSDKVLTLCR